MSLFGNKYRIESARHPTWDYASPGWYFVTICTRHRQPFFGQIIASQMQLSPMGEIMASEWQGTPIIRLNVALDAWVIMPDHVHGIVVILEPSPGVETSRRDVSTGPGEPSHWGVETSRRDVSTQRRDDSTRRRLLQAGSLGAIIGQVKSICTKRIWAAGQRDFAWQPRFYDTIIRDQRMLDNIRRYIAENPARWEKDHRRNPGPWM